MSYGVAVKMSKKTKTHFERELDRLYDETLCRPELYTQVRQSKAFMKQYHAGKIALNDLAAAAFMSRFHYVRVFQQVYGLTPINYLRDLRISKSKTLLRKVY